ncbi:MAG: helix-turn-helix domain-containing protein [Nitrospinota bacterium]
MTNWLTLEEALRYLKMGKSTLYNLASNEKVPAHRMGRAWRANAGELDRWPKEITKFFRRATADEGKTFGL